MDPQSSSVCVISLDALDLNFLKGRFVQNSKASIHSNLYFNDNCYYEFQVKTDDHLDVHEESKKKQEELKYIQCHICKIEVPQQFYYEHKNSMKHEINIKIANEAVQRLQKHVNCNYEKSYYKNNSSIYFCPICAITMDGIEKSNHENSIGHKNSIIVEKFLIDFLYMYSNKVYEDYDSIKSITSTASTSSIETIDFNTQEKVINISNDKNTSEKMCMLNLNENQPNITGLEDYIAFLKEQYASQKNNFNVINEFTLEITTIDKSIVRVSAENFHGFKDLPRRFTICNVCKEIFNKSSREEHILSECHIKFVCLPLSNRDCLRNITDSWNHCVLCNAGLEGISNVTSHISSCEHLNNIKKCLISENQQNNNTICNSQLCNVQSLDTCAAQGNNTSQNAFEKAINIVSNMTTAIKENELPVLPAQNIDSVNLNANLSNEKSKQHDNTYEKKFCSYCNVFISIKGFQKHSNTVKHIMNTLSDLHYFMNASGDDDSDDYICRICDEKVTDNEDNVKQHTELPNHLKLYNTLLQNNNIKKLNNKTLFCTPCNEMIFIKNELFHINSKTHKMLSDNNDDETLNAVPSPLEAETSTNRDDPASFFCNICNVDVPNTKNNIQIHIKGRPHVNNMNKLFHKNVSKENKSAVEINNTAQKSQTAIKHLYILKTQDSSILKCTVCDVYITNNEGNIVTHVKGSNHKNSYNIIVERNGLQINGTDVYCNTCSVHISLGNEINHCKGKNHIQKLSAT